MKYEFRRLAGEALTPEAYEVYRHCMYMPTMEKYLSAAKCRQQDDRILTYACTQHDRILGMIVLALEPDNAAEIVGIAVAEGSRGRGIGSEMLIRAADLCCLKSMRAETDDEAIGFYRKNGFDITEDVRYYDGKAVARYRCTRNF